LLLGVFHAAAEPPRSTNAIGMVFITVPAGQFVMGSPREYAEAMAKKVTYNWYRESAPSETPPRRVTISRAFALGQTEVTLAQFRKFVDATGYKTDAERDGKGASGQRDGRWVEQSPAFSWAEMGYTRADDEPVVNVSWNDAVAFCGWLTQTDGVTYRLPTEAEWEYACRAGTTTPAFWGEDDRRRKEYAWSAENSGDRPHPVARLQANPWGLHDMLGNVYEYCADGWSTNVAVSLGKPAANEFMDPLVPSGGAGSEIVVRSTSWGTNPLHCRSAFRGSAGKTHRNLRDGFRVVRERAIAR
jgi:formylglycine-generating enzyme required for sulfatase activity